MKEKISQMAIDRKTAPRSRFWGFIRFVSRHFSLFRFPFSPFSATLLILNLLQSPSYSQKKSDFPFRSKFQNMSKIGQQTPEIVAFKRGPLSLLTVIWKLLVCCNFLLSSNSYMHTLVNRNDFWLFSGFQNLVLFPWLTAVNWKFLKNNS